MKCRITLTRDLRTFHNASMGLDDEFYDTDPLQTCPDRGASLYVALRILYGWRRAIPQWGPHGSDKVRWGSSKGASAPERPVGFAGRVWPRAHPVYRLRRAGSLSPPHSFYPHRNQSIWGRAPAVAGHFVVWPTPSIGLKIGSWYPKRSRKDSGRGRGSPLTRAFAGSKPHARTRPRLLIYLRLYCTWFSMVRL
ncbi:hypothetical protein HD554DRAFT_666837 [Boletus coccyginus]|nr:hypothetical protein HD554DRAFT_666837 [Boletus coccyginus]